MDPRARKLAQALNISIEQAKGLVEIGLDVPAKIKQAKESEIEEARGVGKATAQAIKGRWK